MLPGADCEFFRVLPGRTAGREVRGDADDATEGEPTDPLAPDDDVESAYATAGIAASAQPTPNATARGPTRPTKRARPDISESRSIGRADPLNKANPFVDHPNR